jgi:RES domain-containing protein
MPVNPGLTVVAPAGRTYYRITSLSFNTTTSTDHPKVVNGQGAVNSRIGARYNHPGVCTVYLAEDLLTCLAEKMFYFHREVIRGIDLSHRLITAGRTPGPFINQATQVLDFTTGEVRINPGSPGATLPATLSAYSSWTRVRFNH